MHTEHKKQLDELVAKSSRPMTVLWTGEAPGRCTRCRQPVSPGERAVLACGGAQVPGCKSCIGTIVNLYRRPYDRRRR